jgi:SAM-dependent methyltransferase
LTSLEEFPERSEQEARDQESYYSEETGARFLRGFEWAIAFFMKLRARSILSRVRGRGRDGGAMLDVGCGRGDLLELFQNKGWRALGTQVSRTASSAARDHRHVEVVVGELPELGLSKGSFQVITFFHVLEHLDRPAEYLRAAYDLLSSRGLLVVEVPDGSSPGFRLLGRRCLTFDFPHHLVFFTPSSLRLLLEKSGFRVADICRFSIEYSPFTTLQNLLNLLPGEPNLLYRALMRNEAGRRLRKRPLTWVHAFAGMILAGPALLLSLGAMFLPSGNNVRFYCRKA